MILFNGVLENLSPVRTAEMGRPDGEISFPVISITNSFVDLWDGFILHRRCSDLLICINPAPLLRESACAEPGRRMSPGGDELNPRRANSGRLSIALA
jgi:hypothetical protein